jgi:hypothetical protein
MKLRSPRIIVVRGSIALGLIGDDKPTSRYLMLRSPIQGIPTDGTVLVSGEYLGLLVILE